MFDASTPALAVEPTGEPVRPAGATGLSTRMAALAGRVGAVVARSVDRGDPRLDPIVALLRSPPMGDDGPGPAARFDRLIRVTGASPLERDCLLLAAMAEAHEGFSTMLRALHPRGEPWASVGLAARILCEHDVERSILRSALEGGPLVRCGALVVSGDAPFFERTVRPAEALYSAICGADAWPPGLTPESATPPSGGLSGFFAGEEGSAAIAAIASDGPRTVLVDADSLEVATHRGAALAMAAGRVPVILNLRSGAPPELGRLAALSAIVRGRVPVLGLASDGGAEGVAWPDLEAIPGPVVVCCRSGAGAVRGARAVVGVSATRLGAVDRSAAWTRILPELSGESAALGSRYSIEPGAIGRVATDVRSTAALQGRDPRLDDVERSVRARGAVALAQGVELRRPGATFADLVLPPDRIELLRDATRRLVHQGRVLEEWGFLRGRPGARGVRLLFAGAPGTGKTLAAEVMAHALGVDLLVVDISRVVSKWVGETEKNLSVVFDVAEQSQAVLLFDEADALFGKRTEVSDAHDRYANLETAYLLTRLERFEGLAVLATNLRQNVDPAFLRRLEFLVEFPEPGPEEREELWRRHLPPGAPLAADLGLPEIAAVYPVVGGFIRNAAVAAAFLAADAGRSIGSADLLKAIRREYEKSGRTFPGVPAGAGAPAGGGR